MICRGSRAWSKIKSRSERAYRCGRKITEAQKNREGVSSYEVSDALLRWERHGRTPEGVRPHSEMARHAIEWTSHCVSACTAVGDERERRAKRGQWRGRYEFTIRDYTPSASLLSFSILLLSRTSSIVFSETSRIFFILHDVTKCQISF